MFEIVAKEKEKEKVIKKMKIGERIEGIPSKEVPLEVKMAI